MKLTFQFAPALALALAFFATSICLPAHGSELPFEPQPLNFTAIKQSASMLPELHSLLISREGKLVFEEYFAGKNRSQAANMKSASKSVISALVGIAIDKGLIESVNQPITEFFPELQAQNSNISNLSAKQNITIENLLTMQAGLASTSGRNYGRWVLSEDWVSFALNQPLQTAPGTAMIYSTGSTHLLSAIIERASGMSAKEFAQQNLASPMNFRMAYWSQDPQGIYFGGNDMEITPRQMLAFGQLYLNDGIHEGERVISEEWVEVSHQAHAESPRGQGRYYGYGWWIRELAGLQVPLAWGYGGQLIFVVRELDMVVVVTSDSNPRQNRFGHLSRVYDLVETQILAVGLGNQGPHLTP